MRVVLDAALFLFCTSLCCMRQVGSNSSGNAKKPTADIAGKFVVAGVVLISSSLSLGFFSGVNFAKC